MAGVCFQFFKYFFVIFACCLSMAGCPALRHGSAAKLRGYGHAIASGCLARLPEAEARADAEESRGMVGGEAGAAIGERDLPVSWTLR